MLVLKRLKASSLMETLIATVLIMAIFILSSLILNNLFSNAIKSRTRGITARLNYVEYQVQHDHLQIPYVNEWADWSISVDREGGSETGVFIFKAEQLKTERRIEQRSYESQ